MALNYNTIQALVNKKYMKTLYNNVFTKKHYLWARLKAKAGTYSERTIVTDLEYADASTIQFASKNDTIALRDEELITAAEWDPKMLTASLMIYLEDELKCNSDMAVKKLIDVKMKNLQRAIEKKCATVLWTRGADALADTKGWNNIDFLINNVSATVGGIAVVKDTTNSWWQSQMVDVTGTDYDGDPTSEADLVNPTKDVYLKKLLQRGIAKCAGAPGGDVPNVIVLPQYLWDLLEFILDPQKTGSKMNVKAGEMGFTALDYRGIPIIADDDMVAAQTGDTDGRIYFLNDNYLYFWFHAGAKFKAEPFVKPANQNLRSSLVNAYGNLTITNRAAQCVMTGLRSPQSYGYAAA